jgi:hypothetical protein
VVQPKDGDEVEINFVSVKNTFLHLPGVMP